MADNLFAGLGDLANIYRQSNQYAQQQQALQQFAQSGSQFDPATRQLIAVNPQLGMTLANLAEASRRDQRDYALREKDYKLREVQSNRRESPEAVRTLEAAGIDPRSPEGRKALFPKTDTPISATDKKAIMSAEDDVPRLEATIKNVTAAKALNPQVYSGYTAGLRGQLGAMLPDAVVPDFIASKAGGKATTEWDQLMGQEAIKMMSETLKGASTDFEMRKFIGIAADTRLDPDSREKAMDRFLDLANAELALRKNRASGLRTGDYFKPEGAAKPDANAWKNKDTITAARANPQAAIAEAKAAIAAGKDPNMIKQRLQQVLPGVDLSGL